MHAPCLFGRDGAAEPIVVKLRSTSRIYKRTKTRGSNAMMISLAGMMKQIFQLWGIRGGNTRVYNRGQSVLLNFIPQLKLTVAGILLWWSSTDWLPSILRNKQ